MACIFEKCDYISSSSESQAQSQSGRKRQKAMSIQVQYFPSRQSQDQDYSNKNSALKGFKQKNVQVLYIDDPIGTGSYASVYRGIISQQKKKVAIKILNLQIQVLRAKNPNYQRQLKILQNIKHPNIVKFFFSHIDQSNFLYIVMQRCHKKTLQKVIQKASKKGTGLKDRKIFKYSLQLLSAVKVMHQNHIMHRDLKPANILFNFDGIKIADFGIAKSLQPDRSRAEQTTAGTQLYMSPQQLNAIRNINDQYITIYSLKCDIWSLGLIIYQMLVGEKLFSLFKDLNCLLQQSRKPYEPIIKEKLKGKNTFWTNLLIKHMLVYQQQKRSTAAEIENLILAQRQIFQKESRQKSYLKSIKKKKYIDQQNYEKQVQITRATKKDRQFQSQEKARSNFIQKFQKRQPIIGWQILFPKNNVFWSSKSWKAQKKSFIEIEDFFIFQIDMETIPSQMTLFPCLKRLNLTNNNIKNIDYLYFNAQLRQLYLDRNKIQKIRNLKSQYLPDLRKLYLSSNLIQRTQYELKLQSLQILDLSYNKLRFLTNFSQLEQLPKLRYLNMNGNPGAKLSKRLDFGRQVQIQASC